MHGSAKFDSSVAPGPLQEEDLLYGDASEQLSQLERDTGTPLRQPSQPSRMVDPIFEVPDAAGQYSNEIQEVNARMYAALS
jgi:hypothetical protein